MSEPTRYIIVENIKKGQKGIVLWECKKCETFSTVRNEDGSCKSCGNMEHDTKYILTEDNKG